MNLFEAISNRTCKIGVLGLGHVGLATAGVFANQGFMVFGCDLIQRIVKSVMSGNFNHPKSDLAEMINNAVESGRLWATTDPSGVARSCDVIMICVPTPLSRQHKADLSFLKSACETVGHALTREKLVIIESTVPPGTIKRVSTMLESMSGLSCGKDFWLSYCPERLTPSDSIRDFVKNDRIIGGFDAQSTRLASHLFRQVVKGQLLLSDSVTAETAKLAENAFRDVNIAFANELALICEQVGTDVKEVIKLANTHRRVNIHAPGCGVGGACLPKDPYFLLAAAKQHAEHSVIRCSRSLNSFMESHTVSTILTALRLAKKDVDDSRISVLGVSYKKGTDETRNTPARFVIQELLRLGAQVSTYDPLSTESFGGRKCTTPYEAIANTDCLVILTDHNEFASLDLQKVKKIMRNPACIVDGRRVIDPARANSFGIKYYGIGVRERSQPDDTSL